MDGKNHWTDLHQIHKEDGFGLSLRVWMWRSKVKVKVTKDKELLCTDNTPRYGQNGTPSLQITSRKQQMRRFDCCRGMFSPRYMHWAWALPHISSLKQMCRLFYHLKSDNTLDLFKTITRLTFPTRAGAIMSLTLLTAFRTPETQQKQPGKNKITAEMTQFSWFPCMLFLLSFHNIIFRNNWYMFYRPDVLPVSQWTVLKHWREPRNGSSTSNGSSAVI